MDNCNEKINHFSNDIRCKWAWRKNKVTQTCFFAYFYFLIFCVSKTVIHKFKELNGITSSAVCVWSSKKEC